MTALAVDLPPAPHPAPAALKRIFLSLLPTSQLIELVLAVDHDRLHAAIFPDALQEAVDALQSAAPFQPSAPYRWPAHVVTPAGPNATARAPLFTSAPLVPSRRTAATKAELREEREGLPSYEDMIVLALADVQEADGTAPKTIFQWMDQRYSLQTNFRPSASQALQRAFKRGRLEKTETGKYKLNTSWEGDQQTSKRATRRPKIVVKKEPAQLCTDVGPPPPTLSAAWPRTKPCGAATPPDLESQTAVDGADEVTDLSVRPSIATLPAGLDQAFEDGEDELMDDGEKDGDVLVKLEARDHSAADVLVDAAEGLDDPSRDMLQELFATLAQQLSTLVAERKSHVLPVAAPTHAAIGVDPTLMAAMP